MILCLNFRIFLLCLSVCVGFYSTFFLGRWLRFEKRSKNWFTIICLTVSAISSKTRNFPAFFIPTPRVLPPPNHVNLQLPIIIRLDLLRQTGEIISSSIPLYNVTVTIGFSKSIFSLVRLVLELFFSSVCCLYLFSLDVLIFICLVLMVITYLKSKLSCSKNKQRKLLFDLIKINQFSVSVFFLLL